MAATMSAGSMVMTPHIGEDFVQWTPPAGGDEALGVVEFSIFPHLDNEDLPHNTMANAERWAAGMQNPVYAIDDETAIKVVDGTVEVVHGGATRQESELNALRHLGKRIEDGRIDSVLVREGDSVRVGEVLGRLDRADHRAHVPGHLFPQEREDQAAEVGAAAARGEDHVRIIARQGELLLRLLADDGLVQQHVVQHRSQAVLGILATGRLFHGLGDCQTERAGIVRILGQGIAAGLGQVRRAGQNLGAPGLHHRPAERFLLVADLDHINPRFDSEHLGRER